MGVSDSIAINLQNKLTHKETKNNLHLLASKQPLNYKNNIKSPINTSKSNQKDKKSKIYSITELNKTSKIPTIKSSPKNNNVNFSSEKNPILTKKSNSRNISFLKEEIQSKKKLNKKIPIYTKDLNSKRKIHENCSFVKKPSQKLNSTEWSHKKKAIKFSENNCSSKKSISPKKRTNEHLFNNWSFNDLSFNNNINSVSVNNYSGLKNVNNTNLLISKKNKKVCFNKNNETQNNKFNKKNINNIKKIKPNIESNLINCFSNTNKDKSIITSNYSSYNKNEIGMKKNFFSLNNNYSFYNNYSLYIIDDENMNSNCNYKKYSDEKDFINIINQRTHNEMKIINDLLKLEQRNWYNELINISIKLNKVKNKIDNYFNKIIEKYILIYEDFNWIIYSLSIYFKNIFNDNNEVNNKTSFNNNTNLGFGLENKIESWFNGFKWKGLYIKVIPYEKSKILINEIKALNYYFFDFLQLIDKSQYIKKKDSKNNLLLNEIIFPLIGYSKISNLVLYVSALIIPEKINITFDKNILSSYVTTGELIEQSNKLLNYYSNVSDFTISSICSYETNVTYNENNNNILNINKNKKPKIYMTLLQNKKYKNFSYLDLESSFDNIFYIKDLLQSKLFKEINKYNLIKIKGGKYIIFNLAKFIPKLFEIKFKQTQKLNFYSEFNKEKKYYTLYLKRSSNKAYHKGENKYIKTPEDVLDKIYNMKNTFPIPLNYKDIFINNIYFRIIYEKTEKSNKDYKTKRFVDHLFFCNTKSNFNVNNNNKSSSVNNCKNDEKYYIKGKYVLLYDLIEPIKLDYSLVKNHQYKNENDSIYKLFYIKTNYLSFFNSWCEMLNKSNFNIKTYSDLKYFMKKYSINTNLLFFTLIYIKNEEILDIIKIHFLIKVIHQLFINEDITLKYKIKLNNIILYIKNILYPHELTFGNERKEFNNFYSKILFFTKIFFLKFKLIDDYMGLGLLNIKLDKFNNNNILNHNKNIKKIIPGFDSPKEFIKHIIFIARKKPFLFLCELEQKLNIIIDPYIKFKSSLSLESMKGEINKNCIRFNNNLIYSFINPMEISGLILVKLLNRYELPNEEKDIDNHASNDSNNESNDETNISENKSHLEIRHNFKNKKMPNIIINKDKKPNNDNNNLLQNNSIILNSNIFINEGNVDGNSQDNSKRKKISKIQLVSVNLSIKKKRLTSPTMDKKENNLHLLSWNDICDKISISLPPICHKLIFNYEEKLNNYNIKIKSSISNYLKHKYTIIKSEVLNNWKECNLNIFQNVRSCNGNVESALLKSYIYLFIYNYFITKNIEESKNINKEIKSIFKNGHYKLSLNELALINLFQGLLCDNYIDSEEFSSKCLMLFLMNYGDPRGRNNDSHGIIQYPLWLISRKIFKLKETILYENVKEMYQTIDYFESKKYFYFKNYNSNTNINNKNNNFNYVDNVQNNIDNILLLNNLNKKTNYFDNNRANNSFNSNNISNYNSKKLLSELDKNRSFISNNKPLSSLINKELVLSLSIFNNNYLEREKINGYFFPSISSKVDNVQDEFFKENFIVYIFKQIKSLFLSRHLVLDSEYINEIISNEIFLFENNVKDSDFSSSNDITSVDTKTKSEEMPNNSNNINNINNELGTNSIKYNNNNIGKKKNNGNVFGKFLNVELLDKLSYKKNIPSGVIISFGNNPHNETSHDKYEILSLPRVVFKLKNVIIDHIYSGWEHNIVISNKGEIFSFGYNQSYQCGLPNSNLLCNNSINDPTNISILHNIYGKIVSCGNEHSLILSKNNEVYGVGNNEDGVLGLNDTKIKTYKPILIHFGDKDEYTKKIKQISCGTVHNLALTDDGKIFSWGAAMGGQLGHEEKLLMKNSGNKNLYLSKPTIISKLVDMKINANKISCGEAHSIALSKDGNVYSWGFGSNGQLGLGFCEDSFELGKGLAKSRKLLPEKINISSIKNIECGKTFTMLINKDNKLLACGNNDLNQLGFNLEKTNNKRICNDLIYPTLIDSFSTFEVKKISCGEGHCLAIINDISFSGVQSVWSWGNNKFGQLGQGSTTKVCLPKPMYLLTDYSNLKRGFDEISCGGFHSLCLIKYKENINWIYDDFDKKIVKTIEEVGIY